MRPESFVEIARVAVAYHGGNLVKRERRPLHEKHRALHAQRKQNLAESAPRLLVQERRDVVRVVAEMPRDVRKRHHIHPAFHKGDNLRGQRRGLPAVPFIRPALAGNVHQKAHCKRLQDVLRVLVLVCVLNHHQLKNPLHRARLPDVQVDELV